MTDFDYTQPLVPVYSVDTFEQDKLSLVMAERDGAKRRLHELELENAQLYDELRTDTAHHTVAKLQELLEGRTNELRLADEALAAHRQSYSDLATEYKAVSAALKDLQSIVRQTSSLLDTAAAQHDPTLWQDWVGRFPRTVVTSYDRDGS